MFVKPKAGLKVPDPALKDYLPEAGRDVGDDNRLFWIGREADGDVTIETPAVGAAEKLTRRAKE